MTVSADRRYVFIPMDVRPSLTFANTGVFFPESNSKFLLPDRWALHLYRYDAEFMLDETSFLIAPGTISITPPGVRSTYRFRGRSEHYCFHFQFSGDTSRTMKIPAVIDVRGAMAAYVDIFQESIRLFSINPLHAEIKAWDLLLTLSDTKAAERFHAVYRRAVAYIESHLHEDTGIASIAAKADVSVSHLTRLFKRYAQMTPAAYIRARRMSISRYLLEKTDLSVKEVAFRVGIRDLQVFNKITRRFFGHSPRNLR
ncbi:MAG: helix-turn-helix transcriptional regulator [Spirochaetota bacterium]